MKLNLLTISYAILFLCIHGCSAEKELQIIDLGVEEIPFGVKDSKIVSLFISSTVTVESNNKNTINRTAINSCINRIIIMKIYDTKPNEVLTLLKNKSKEINSEIKDCLSLDKNMVFRDFSMSVEKIIEVKETKSQEKPPEPIPVEEYIEKHGLGEKT